MLRPFQERLQAALKEGLAGSAETAIDACRVQAPAIAAELSSSGVELGRTSHKLRNPANAPRARVAPLLAKAVADPTAATPEIVALDGGSSAALLLLPGSRYGSSSRLAAGPPARRVARSAISSQALTSGALTRDW